MMSQLKQDMNDHIAVAIKYYGKNNEISTMNTEWLSHTVKKNLKKIVSKGFIFAGEGIASNQRASIIALKELFAHVVADQYYQKSETNFDSVVTEL